MIDEGLNKILYQLFFVIISEIIYEIIADMDGDGTINYEVSAALLKLILIVTFNYFSILFSQNKEFVFMMQGSF